LFIRKQLPVLVGFVGGIIVLGGFFLTDPSLRKAASTVVSWRTTLAAFALVLGAMNLVKVNWNRASAGKPIDRLAGLALLVPLVIMVVIGLTSGTTAKVYAYMYDNVYRSGAATVFSLNAFFVVSAAYRAFRIRNAHAALFMVAGLIAVLGPASIGAYLWGQLPVIADWVLKVPSMGATRGFEIGLALGIVSMGARTLLGIERGYFGGE